MRLVSGPIWARASIEKSNRILKKPAPTINSFLLFRKSNEMIRNPTPNINVTKPCRASDRTMVTKLRKVFTIANTFKNLVKFKNRTAPNDITAKMESDAAAKLGLPSVVMILL